MDMHAWMHDMYCMYVCIYVWMYGRTNGWGEREIHWQKANQKPRQESEAASA